jgi:hypothetical protein
VYIAVGDKSPARMLACDNSAFTPHSMEMLNHATFRTGHNSGRIIRFLRFGGGNH